MFSWEAGGREGIWEREGGNREREGGNLGLNFSILAGGIYKINWKSCTKSLENPTIFACGAQETKEEEKENIEIDLAGENGCMC